MVVQQIYVFFNLGGFREKVIHCDLTGLGELTYNQQPNLNMGEG